MADPAQGRRPFEAEPRRQWLAGAALDDDAVFVVDHSHLAACELPRTCRGTRRIAARPGGGRDREHREVLQARGDNGEDRPPAQIVSRHEAFSMLTPHTMVPAEPSSAAPTANRD